MSFKKYRLWHGLNSQLSVSRCFSVLLCVALNVTKEMNLPEGNKERGQGRRGEEEAEL